MRNFASAFAVHDFRVRWLFDLVIFLAATFLTHVAQSYDRPITAVLVYLTGVMLIGARSGMVPGVVAAIAASFFYNFFLSEPVFRLGASSADEVVPLIAFNLSAIVAGVAAGRLQDSVRLANSAKAKNSLLLKMSGKLQTAISPEEVVSKARSFLSDNGRFDLSVFLWRDDKLKAVGDSAANADSSSDFDDLIGQLSDRDPDLGYRVLPLHGADGEIGAVTFSFRSEAQLDEDLPDLQAIANLLALAIDRCMLQEKLSESVALQRSEELKSAIISSVSHDLRTPLTAISAAASSLRSFEDNLTASQRLNMLLTIEEQCEQLNKYTANLLDMGRIQVGIPEELFAPVDLLDILGVVTKKIRDAYPNQVINKDLPAIEANVFANAAMLEQAIYNILENAIIHGQAEEPVQLHAFVESGSAVLEVTDYGAGIPPADQPYVFERFYRSPSHAKRSGSGLGLYIANGFIRAFGGEITIMSPVLKNCGTLMRITLPLVSNRNGD